MTSQRDSTIATLEAKLTKNLSIPIPKITYIIKHKI